MLHRRRALPSLVSRSIGRGRAPKIDVRKLLIAFKFLRRYLNRPLPVALQKRFSDEQASAVTVDNMIADRVIIDEGWSHSLSILSPLLFAAY